VGLAAALEWNVAGEPEAYADVAAAWNRAPDTIARAYTDLCSTVQLAEAMATLDIRIDPELVATTMIAPENQPMLHNNARLVDDSARVMLAEATLSVWQRLRP
jgi:hypothetical protein